MGKLIFLDIDGVLRRVTSNPSYFDQDCLDNFESAVRQCDKSKIVISSTWRLAMPLKELRSQFSPDVAARIVGITPENFDDEVYERHAEIKAFLEEKKVTALPWLAIDDDPAHFPAGCPVLFTDPNKGFDAECAVRLVKMLRGC
ncbi:MAG: HAD domain-containing protein [Gallionella sp.]|nr:HAD domain-containing protein [Gallionella sp.]